MEGGINNLTFAHPENGGRGGAVNEVLEGEGGLGEEAHPRGKKRERLLLK